MTRIKLAARIVGGLAEHDPSLVCDIDELNPNVINVIDSYGKEFTVIVHNKEDAE